MAISKINYGNTTLIDLTSDTVTTETLAKGTTAHDASGAKITGTLESGGGGSSDVKFVNVKLASGIFDGSMCTCYSTYLGRVILYSDSNSSRTISLPVGSVLILSHSDIDFLEGLLRDLITPSSALYGDTFFDEMHLDYSIAIVRVVDGLTIAY